jgi:hypothetical protein
LSAVDQLDRIEQRLITRRRDGRQSAYRYRFRDRDAAEHWLADERACLDADVEIGTANRRGTVVPVAAGPVFRGVVMSDAHLAEFQQGAIGSDPAFQSTSAVDPFDLSHSSGPVRDFVTGGAHTGGEAWCLSGVSSGWQAIGLVAALANPLHPRLPDHICGPFWQRAQWNSSCSRSLRGL